MLERLLDLKPKFGRLLTEEEVFNLSQSDFIDYLREQLWDRTALEKYGKNFSQLSLDQKQDIDLVVLIRISEVLHQVNKER